MTSRGGLAGHSTGYGGTLYTLSGHTQHSVPRGGKKSLFDMPNFRHKDSFSSNIS